MIRLYTTTFDSPHASRAKELRFCLDENAEFFDIVCAPHDRTGRKTFRDLCAIAGEAMPDDLVVISNCDILFSHESLKLIEQRICAGECFALSRWEGKALHNCAWSQDVWAFRGPPLIPPGAGEYFFGVPGCDNRFAHDLDVAGYRVLNPSKTIITKHVHASRIRTDTNSIRYRVDPPYLLVAPHHVGESATLTPIPTLKAFRAALPGGRRHEVKETEPNAIV